MTSDQMRCQSCKWRLVTSNYGAEKFVTFYMELAIPSKKNVTFAISLWAEMDGLSPVSKSHKQSNLMMFGYPL